ncbi:hypothetical protein NEAUS05_0162 [Nematocida ausubeli]|nr:hypothetical protein NEAUS05_0162 [Nematocida ausubeli]
MISRLILNLMMVQSIITRISVKDIKKTQEAFFGPAQDVIINPEGPLNLLHGYIGIRNGYMYNKRFYSFEIETDYKLSKKETPSTSTQEYSFIRTPVNDKIYKELDTESPTGKYLSTYHAQLIKMFPSVDGSLSIEAGRPNSLTNFLRADHVKKDAKYILAGLLLLSEGVDVKINVDHTEKKKKLVIKSKACEEKEFINVEMYTASIDSSTNKQSNSVYQGETAEIVNFYIRCRDNPLLKRGRQFAMPTTREEFENGLFLNSAGFLIQTYIYEFIDTAEDYMDFVNAVHELLIDQVVEKENPEQTKKKGKKGRIFDELFLAKEALSESIKYIESFCNLVKATNEDARFPFYNSSQLPQFTRIPQCKEDRSGFVQDRSLYYSNCVESALLGLFCCMAYNPETGKYEVDHMGKEISDELKKFFRDYPNPTETTDFEMHKRWSTVVACLENDKIDYVCNKNELLSGVVNIFLTISEITGQKKDILKLVEYIENACMDGKLDTIQEFYIMNEIESIIRSLSQNKNVEVECDQMVLGQRSNDKADLLAEIKITYTFNNAKNGISLEVENGHTTLALLLLSRGDSAHLERVYEEVRNTYASMDSYIGYITNQYIAAELNALKTKSHILLVDLMNSIDTMLSTKSTNIHKIFLLGKLSSTDFKTYIIERFIVFTIDFELGPTNPAILFTANILGSVPLNDATTRYNMMRYFPVHAKWQKYYPKLGFKPYEHLSKKEINCINMASLNFYNTLLSWPASTTTKAICNYLKATMHTSSEMHYLLIYFIASKPAFDHLAPARVANNLVKIQSTLEETKSPNEEKNINFVYTLWFIHMCRTGRDFPPNFIKKVYSFILFDHMLDVNGFKTLEISDEEFKNCVSFLQENKTLFCSKNDRRSIENYDTLVSYFRTENDEGLYGNIVEI